MNNLLTEITPLSERDCFYIVDRHKTYFDYPLHGHKEYELNFVENGEGVKRVIGDRIEVVGAYDLVLICAEDMEHEWSGKGKDGQDIREITIQFSPELFGRGLLAKNQFASICKMFRDAKHGIAFSLDAIMRVYSLLDSLAHETEHFQQFLDFLRILYILSKSNYRILSSSSFSHAERNTESRRILKVKQYINEHYAEPLRLNDMAEMVGMSPVSFSRFFKLRSGRTLTDYVLDIRLGFAARMLVDSSKNISEICYECGFNNISNFNRIFKSKRGSTPKEFRQLFRKNKVIV